MTTKWYIEFVDGSVKILDSELEMWKYLYLNEALHCGDKKIIAYGEYS